MTLRRPALLFLNNQGLAGLGGGPTILRHLVDGLSEEYDITVASQDPPAEEEQRPYPGVTQVQLAQPPPPGRLWRIAPVLRARHLAKILPPELIQQASLVIAIDVHTGLALRRTRPARMAYLSLSCVPIQERAMGSGAASTLQYAWLERQLARQAEAVIVSSQAHAADLHRWTRLPALRPIVLHPTLPPSRAGERPPNTPPAPAAVTILAAGRLVAGKNFTAIIALADRLRDLPCRWVIAGDGPDLPSLQAEAAAKYLEARISFPGAAPDLQDLLAQSDILLHPSHYESFGMVLFEAMHAGLPVLCGPKVGAIEIMPPGADFVLDMTRLDAVEARLRALIADPALRTTLGRLAHTSARAALDPAYLDGVRGVIRQLLPA